MAQERTGGYVQVMSPIQVMSTIQSSSSIIYHLGCSGQWPGKSGKASLFDLFRESRGILLVVRENFMYHPCFLAVALWLLHYPTKFDCCMFGQVRDVICKIRRNNFDCDWEQSGKSSGCGQGKVISTIFGPLSHWKLISKFMLIGSFARKFPVWTVSFRKK